MKLPRSLNITERETGSGRQCVPGDVAVCHCTCTRRKGDIVFGTEPDSPYLIRVGARDCYVGIEYGLIGMRVGGRRIVTVAPNLIYNERKTYCDLPAGAMLVYDLALISLPEKWDADMDRRLNDPADSTQLTRHGG
ncbi:MAG: FKBP-type peptidyl-prolyl cis-trans isomerase [Acaryochloris sp. CRU_2_0]|nr:FKBP-type peptidyl-prolyl cis-trans isomerase [Acaryochloris sp. CRU_2_0]